MLTRFILMQYGVLSAKDILQDRITDFEQLQGNCSSCRADS